MAKESVKARELKREKNCPEIRRKKKSFERSW